MVTFAFYKGDGKLIDRVIRWWTKSQFSHVAIIINGVICYEADAWKARVCKREWDANSTNWILKEVPIDTEWAISFLQDKVGKFYDYPGVLGFVFPTFRKGVQTWWYCSELAAAVAKFKTTKLSPGDLANIILGYR